MASYYEPDYYIKELMKSVEERIKKMTADGLAALDKKKQEIESQLKK